jgi:uncharacterized membrane protein
LTPPAKLVSATGKSSAFPEGSLLAVQRLGSALKDYVGNGARVRVRGLQRWTRIHAVVLALLAVATAWGSFWLYVDTLRYLSFNAYINDLGLELSYLIAISHTTNLHVLWLEVTPQKPFVLVLAGVTLLSPSAITLLAIQAYLVCLAALPLYGIALHFSKRRDLSLLLSLTYLFFFPLSTILWFDFHVMSLFGFFFLTGIWLYLRNSRWSVVFLLLAATTNIALAGVVILFGIVEGTALLRFDRRAGKGFLSFLTQRRGRLLTFIVGGTSLLFVYYSLAASIQTLATFQTPQNVHGGLVTYYISNFLYNAPNLIIVTLLIAVPFIPLLSVVPARNLGYAYLLLPFSALYLFSNYAFSYLNAQYTGALLTPELFLVAARALSPHESNVGSSEIPYSRSFRSRHRWIVYSHSLDSRHRAVAIMLVFTVGISLFYTPWGPFNSDQIPGTNPYFDFWNKITVTPVDQVADGFANLVPPSATILLQDNMPIFADRNKNNIFGTGNLPWLGPENEPGPTPSSLIPDFMCTDVQSSWFTNPFTSEPSQGNMSYWFNYFYAHYQYGLLAFDWPFALWELNYSKAPNVYYPTLFTLPSIAPLDLNWTNGKPVTPFPLYTSIGYAYPGTYSATVELAASNVAIGNPANDTLTVRLGFHNATGAEVGPFERIAMNDSLSPMIVTLSGLSIASITSVFLYVNDWNMTGTLRILGGVITYDPLQTQTTAFSATPARA